MGRHAAPSEDEPEVAEADQVTVPLAAEARPPGSRPLPRPRGRHSHPDDDDEDDAPAAAVATLEPEPTPRFKREGATAADLRLLRSDSALRNRVIAAVIVPFVLYTVILLIVGRLDAFAVWVWLPLISAGISGGLLLDRAHAKSKKT